MDGSGQEENVQLFHAMRLQLISSIRSKAAETSLAQGK